MADLYGTVAVIFGILAFMSGMFTIFALIDEPSMLKYLAPFFVVVFAVTLFSGFRWDDQVDHNRAVRRAERGCVNVALEQIDVMYNGKEYLLEDASRREWLCAR